MIQKQRYAFNFFLCGGLFFFFDREKAFKPQIKSKSFHCFLFFPPSKSYERVFVNDWGTASLNKSKMLRFFFFLFFFL